MAKIVWTDQALEWMRTIDIYLAERNPDAAVHTLEGIIKRVEAIGPFPRVGGLIAEKEPREVRVVLYGSYQIIYEVRFEEEVHVLVVVHAAMDLSEIDF